MNVTETNHEPNSSVRRIPELDGIRGIAILLVLIWHYAVSQIRAEPHSIAYYAQRGLGLTWSGVDLFFVLSGFLIGGILLDNRDTSNYFKVFYVRRICRIFPLYFLWLSLFVALTYVLPNPITTPPFNWLFQKSIHLWSYMTFTQNIAMAQKGAFGPNWLGITWSLAVEEQFYLALPLIIYFIPTRRLHYVLFTLIFLAPVLRTSLFYFHPRAGFPAYVLMPCRADALLLGVLCAYITRQENLMRFLRRHLVLIYVSGTILLLGAATLIVKGETIVGSLAMSSYGYTLLAFLYACFLFIAVTEKRGFVSAITRIKALRNLGVIA